MARVLRTYDDPSEIHLVGGRCLEARHYFKPCARLNAIVLGCLAHSIEDYGVDVFAFVFMSNHYHMLVRAMALNLSAFMGHFQSGVAKQLNAFHGRSGVFFGDRFKGQPVLDDEALRRLYVYTAVNPCAAGLVEHPSAWPGLCSHNALVAQEPLVGSWVEREGRRVLERSAEIKLARLPEFEALDAQAYAQTMAELVDARVDALREQREAEAAPVLGAAKVCAKAFTDRPKRPKRSPQPRVIAACPERRRARLEVLRMVSALYQAALRRVRRGEHGAAFPVGTFPPGWTRPVVEGSPSALGAVRQRRRVLGLRADAPRDGECGRVEGLLRVWPPWGEAGPLEAATLRPP